MDRPQLPETETPDTRSLAARYSEFTSNLEAANARPSADGSAPPPVTPINDQAKAWIRTFRRFGRWVWAGFKKTPVSKTVIWAVAVTAALLLAGPALAVFLAHGYALVLKLWTLGPLGYAETLQKAPNTDLFADLRNIGLVLLGLIALPLAIWRGWTAHTQARVANKQHALAEKGLIIDRFQKGAQMLESEELSVRLAGIYALRELAMSDPAETYIMVQDLLCDFVRERSKTHTPDLSKISKKKPSPGFEPFLPDLKKAMETLSGLRDNVVSAPELEAQTSWKPDLRGANLSGANLFFANLSGAILFDANLSGADLFEVNLSGAFLIGSNLSGTKLRTADLSDADLYEANLSGTVLHGADLSGAKLLHANLSGADLFYADLSDAKLRDADLSDAKLRDANLSGADFTEAKISHVSYVDWRHAWARANNPPRGLPKGLAARIAYREESEAWPDFVDRIMREHPNLGWDEGMKFESPDN